MPEDEVVTAVLGAGESQTAKALAGVVSVKLEESYLALSTRKKTTTYLDYDTVLALTFAPKELADRRTGF